MPLIVNIKDPIECDNVAAIEFTDRSIDYATTRSANATNTRVALYGPRKGGIDSGGAIGERPPSGSTSLLLCTTRQLPSVGFHSVKSQRGGAGNL